MSVVDEIIRIEEDESLSFGNHLSTEKQKVNHFEAGGDVYDVKSYKEITRLKKNDMLLLESVPGTTIHFFKMDENQTSFLIEGFEDTQITMELQPDENYKIYVDDVNIGKMKAGMAGKINFSIGLNAKRQKVKVTKM